MSVDIKKLAKLSRLSIPESDVAVLQEKMNLIIKMVEDLPEVTDQSMGVDENDPMVLRKDIVTPSLKQQDLLRNAPKVSAGCIVVPKVME